MSELIKLEKQKKKTPCMIFRKWLLLCFVWLNIGLGFAQQQDSTTVQLRSFDQEKVLAFKKDRQFDYDKNVTSFLDWLWQFIKGFFNPIEDAEINPDQDLARLIGVFFLIALVVAIVFFGIKVFAKSSFTGFLSGKNYKAKLEAEISDVDIRTFPFDDEIAQAEQKGHFSVALRYRYLQMLKFLEQQELIVWRQNKTNYEYWRELNGSKLEDPFKEITSVFEYSWYGQYEMDASQYDFYRKMMIRFNEQLPKNTVSLT